MNLLHYKWSPEIAYYSTLDSECQFGLSEWTPNDTLIPNQKCIVYRDNWETNIHLVETNQFHSLTNPELKVSSCSQRTQSIACDTNWIYTNAIRFMLARLPHQHSSWFLSSPARLNPQIHVAKHSLFSGYHSVTILGTVCWHWRPSNPYNWLPQTKTTECRGVSGVTSCQKARREEHGDCIDGRNV